MGFIRKAAVAGSFYPAEPAALSHDLQRLMAQAPGPATSVPKAIVAPHAGYIYSGPIAASAYARVAPLRGQVSRIVVVGPSHRVAFRGVAVSSADAFETPLGRIPLDRPAVEAVLAVPGTTTLDEAHAQEHSLEVHLPFLQALFDRFSLVPLVVGDASPKLVADVLDAVWGGAETLVVISSDLSHYLDYPSAQAIDRQTCHAIERLDPDSIGCDQACGRIPVGGLLLAARRRGLAVETLDLRNSGDTAGPRDRVVGYGAWAFSQGPAARTAEDEDAAELQRHAPAILAVARAAIETRLGVRSEPPAIDPLPPRLRENGACFVTLKRGGDLRGCIGSVAASQPLIQDVAENAVKAAFRDPRFPPLSKAELRGLTLSVAVLTAPRPMSFNDQSDLLRQLRPRIDGLIIEDGPCRALFLPAVWESLPEPADFLAHLKMKAGLPVHHWSPGFTARRFTAVELK